MSLSPFFVFALFPKWSPLVLFHNPATIFAQIRPNRNGLGSLHEEHSKGVFHCARWPKKKSLSRVNLGNDLATLPHPHTSILLRNHFYFVSHAPPPSTHTHTHTVHRGHSFLSFLTGLLKASQPGYKQPMLWSPRSTPHVFLSRTT